MSRLNLDPLIAQFPTEPALAPAGNAGMERSGADSFDEHLRRAQHAAEPPPSRDAREPAASSTSEGGDGSDADAHGQPDVAQTGEAAGDAASENKDRSKSEPEKDGAAAAGQAGSEATSGVAGEVILSDGSTSGAKASGHQGEGEEPPANRSASQEPSAPPQSPPPGSEIGPEKPQAADLADAVETEPQPTAEKSPQAPHQSPLSAKPRPAEAKPGETEAEVGPPSAEAPGPAVAVPSSAASLEPSRSETSSRRHVQRPADRTPAPGSQVEASDDLPEPQANVAAAALPDRPPENVAAELQGLPKPIPGASDAAVKSAVSPDGPAQLGPSTSGPDAQEPRPASPAQPSTAPGAEQIDRVRFVLRVARAFEAAGDQGGNVRLRLHPPELGSLRVELSVRQGMMSARLEAETPQARNLLLDNLPLLRDRLAEQHIKLERFEIDLADPGAGGSGQRSADQPQSETRPAGGGPHAARSRQPATENPPALRAASLFGEGTGFDVTV